MGELKVYLAGELESRFRKAAMGAFGYRKGSLSKAAAEALEKWCLERETAGRVVQTDPSMSAVHGYGQGKELASSASS